MPMKQILLVAKLPMRDQDVVAAEQLFARYQIDCERVEIDPTTQAFNFTYDDDSQYIGGCCVTEKMVREAMANSYEDVDVDLAFKECPRVGLDYDCEEPDYHFVLSRTEAGPYAAE
jgi:hypothetical protein